MLALFQGEGDEERFLIGREFGNRRDHAKVREAGVQIFAAYQFPIECQPIRVIKVAAAEEAEYPGFPGLNGISELAVGKPRVADEGDPADIGGAAFVNFEDQVHPVLRKLDHFRHDPGGEPAAAAIDFDDPQQIGLDPRPRVDDTGPKRDLVPQDFILDAQVSLECDPVDDRVLDDPDHDLASFAPNRHIGEQAGLEQAF